MIKISLFYYIVGYITVILATNMTVFLNNTIKPKLKNYINNTNNKNYISYVSIMNNSNEDA